MSFGKRLKSYETDLPNLADIAYKTDKLWKKIPNSCSLMYSAALSRLLTGWGHRNNPDAEQKMARLLAAWRERQLPVIHVKHDSVNPDSPLRPGQPGNQIRPEVFPGADEVLFSKTVNSAFIGTKLKVYLRQQRISSLVICGMTTDHCVSTSVRMAANLGFEVVVVEDATATFDRNYREKHYRAEDIHTFHLLSLQDEFAQVMTAGELLSVIQHPQFENKSRLNDKKYALPTYRTHHTLPAEAQGQLRTGEDLPVAG
jgi:nicotinamidase-related amidase